MKEWSGAIYASFWEHVREKHGGRDDHSTFDPDGQLERKITTLTGVRLFVPTIWFDYDSDTTVHDDKDESDDYTDDANDDRVTSGNVVSRESSKSDGDG